VHRQASTIPLCFGGGVILTGDRADLERLAAAYPHVQVAAI